MSDILVLLKDTLSGLERAQVALKDIMIRQQTFLVPNVKVVSTSDPVGNVVR